MKLSKDQILLNLVSPLLALGVSFLVGALVIAAFGVNPLSAYWAMIQGALAGNNWGWMLFAATPLIFTGLTLALAFQCGLFNIGGNGQLIVGAMAIAYIGCSFSGLPGYLLLPLVFGAALAMGGLWGWIPGMLKAKRGAHEVVTTIMMNYIAVAIVSYLCTYPLMAAPGWIAQTEILPQRVWVPRFHTLLAPLGIHTPRSNPADATIFLALGAAILVYYLLWKTKIGYELRAVGSNPGAAEYGGIKITKYIVLAMTLSGAIAGLGYSNYILGYQHRLVSDVVTNTMAGFDGITVALLGKNHPLGVVLASFLLAILSTGGLQMEITVGIPHSFYQFLEGIIIVSIIVVDRVMAMAIRKRQMKGVSK